MTPAVPLVVPSPIYSNSAPSRGKFKMVVLAVHLHIHKKSKFPWMMRAELKLLPKMELKWRLEPSTFLFFSRRCRAGALAFAYTPVAPPVAA